MQEDSAGNIWIGTNKKGIIRFDPDEGAFEAFLHNRKGIPNIYYFDMVITKSDKIIATFNLSPIGLAIYDTISDACQIQKVDHYSIR